MNNYMINEDETMITKIEVKNFRNFDHLIFDIAKKEHIIAIYGENGSGKSNLLSTLDILHYSINTFLNQQVFLEWQSRLENEESLVPNDLKFLSSVIPYRTLKGVLENTPFNGIDENVELKYSFAIGNHKGDYTLIYTPNLELVTEELKFTISKQTGLHFKIHKENDIEIKLNAKVFSSVEIRNELVTRIKQYWGNHTLLAIMNELLTSYNKGFIHDNFSPFLLEVMNMMKDIVVSNDMNISHPDLPENFISGMISEDEVYKLDDSERLINAFLSHLYTDFVSVYYQKKQESDNIRYQLFIKKIVSERIIDIPFSQESRGTKQLLKLLQLLIHLKGDNIVVIDELDLGIHDLLVNSLIQDLNSYMKGQLIFTTHDTYLLNNNLSKKGTYILSIDADGFRDIYSISEFHLKPNHNIEKLYKEGQLGGIPMPTNIDFNELLNMEE